jgi:hypothetical protein
MMNTCILKNLRLEDLPATWVKQFSLSPRQRFTVQISVQDVFESTQSNSFLSIQQERIALMRSIEQQLKGLGSEDSEAWIKDIKETRVFSKPKQVF